MVFKVLSAILTLVPFIKQPCIFRVISTSSPALNAPMLYASCSVSACSTNKGTKGVFFLRVLLPSETEPVARFLLGIYFSQIVILFKTVILSPSLRVVVSQKSARLDIGKNKPSLFSPRSLIALTFLLSGSI